MLTSDLGCGCDKCQRKTMKGDMKQLTIPKEVEVTMESLPNIITMGVDEIRKHLPHRYPFLLIDRVTSLVLAESIVAYKNISLNEPFFEGHFPSTPIFPGVLVIEAMAQASGILGFKTLNMTPKSGSVYMLVGVDDVRFKRQIIPGDRLTLYARIVSEKHGLWKFDCTASVDGEVAARALILCTARKVS